MMEGKSKKIKGKSETMRAMLARLLRFRLLPFAFLLLPLLSGCGGVQSALNPVGPQSGRISRLWWLMFYVCTIVFILVIISILLAVYRARQKPSTTFEAAYITPEEGSERRVARVVTGAVLLTGIILFVFLVASFRTGRGYYTVQEQQPVSIKVTGHQWWWEIEYEDQMPSNIFKTANEIHIPVGRLVQLQLTSTDVIHSFWVPNLDGKKDLLPGHDNNIWLKADREGEFYGQCAEFCGHQHAHMRFIVIAESQAKFDAWLEAQRRPAAQAPQATEVARGQQVFLSAPCIMCHTVRGTDAGASIAPDLTHVASRKTIAAGTLTRTRDHLAGWITDSQQVKPGNRMPPVPLPPEDLQALVSYLESLK
ncbi:MAG TPA: cytochrome c oxidase subunit II [Pyrinomonadaceae bacterium]|jgi:cytochrome c oxidase subunit 2